MELVGKVKQINRYPVKSFAGESLETCKIDTYGLYGDRFCALYDERLSGWKSFITARAIPELLTYRTNFLDEEVTISSPNGQKFGWNQDLLDEIQRYSEKKISMTNFRAPNPEDPALMSVDAASILIITDNTLRRLEEMMGKNIDPRRFRANIMVSLHNSKLNERDWIGKKLVIGKTELQLDTFCERCSMITIDPVTLEKDTSLLKKVNEEMNLNFGVYASVNKTGKISVDDQVYLAE